jgi:hypothetical protein
MPQKIHSGLVKPLLFNPQILRTSLVVNVRRSARPDLGYSRLRKKEPVSSSPGLVKSAAGRSE